MYKLTPKRSIATEEAGKLAESEIVIYAKIGDINGLTQADEIIAQEQLEGEFSNGVKCRVRKNTSNREDSYEFTYKTRSNNDLDGENVVIKEVTEYNTPIDAHFFEGFRGIATRFIKKTRYVFNSKNISFNGLHNDESIQLNVDNVKYEVDVYQDEEGNTVDWCKIDVEVDDLIAAMKTIDTDLDKFKLTIKISHLPFLPQEFFIQGDETKKDLVDEIWKQYVRSLNKKPDVDLES